MNTPDSPSTGATVLGDSWLASSMSAEELARLERYGVALLVESGEPVFAGEGDARHLYLILDGVVMPAGEAPSFWLGPGDVCGEVGFVLGLPRTRGLAAFGPGARLLRFDRRVFDEPALAARLLVGLSRGLHVRLGALGLPPDPPDLASYCDPEHPAIASFAQHLRRDSPLETAVAVWRFLSRLPYRFGPWQIRASTTLRQGYGMCTTKANLQVAILRALGLEAGFVETEVSGALIRALLPRAYHPRFYRDSYRHYFGAVRIEGRWVGFDGSFTDETFRAMEPVLPEIVMAIGWDARAHGHANGTAIMRGVDPFDLDVWPDLAAVMRKRPTYDLNNATAMNVVLDRVQRYALDTPYYAASAERLLALGQPDEALAVALAGLSAEVAELRTRIVAHVPPNG